MLLNLNTLRAFAALCVVYYHITSDAGLNLPFNIGTRGVDVFFVISGFIISYVGSRNPEEFFTRRLIRIVPFYWTATFVVFALALVLPNLFRSTRADIVQLVCSLFFIPRETSYAGMFPTLVLGWSLNYEMFFYVLFALSLKATRTWAPVLCSLLITLVLIAIHAADVASPSLNFYARPIVFEFVFGVVVFYLVSWLCDGKVSAKRFLPRWLLFSVMAASIFALALGEYGHGFGLSREISAGVPAFFLVTSAILVERLYGLVIDNRVIHLTGESSYILYLIHPYVVYGILRTLFRNSSALSGLQLAALILGLLAVAVAVAIAIHLFFERPVMEYLRRRLLRPRVKSRSDALHESVEAPAP